MPTITEFVAELGHLSTADRPFGAPDSLALTQVVYMPMEGLLAPPAPLPLRDFGAALANLYPDGFADPFQLKRYHFTLACAKAVRYSGVTVLRYVNHIDPAQETQFCAATFGLADGSRYIAFRGTDLTLAGWKEDLNMSFKPVPAQQEAIAYVESEAGAFSGKLYLGGHSKGGHLSLYAAAHVNKETQARLARVYSFDGPGVDEATLLSEGYSAISPLVESYLPQSSVVGMLLCYHPVFQVVKSSALGLWQHDALTWQVRDGAFETLADLDFATKVADEALRQWIDRLTLSDRQFLTETVFRVIAALETDTIDPLVQDFTASSIRMFAAFRKLEPETRNRTRQMLSDLFASGANEAARLLLPATFRRVVSAPLALSPQAAKVRQKQEEIAELLTVESIVTGEQA